MTNIPKSFSIIFYCISIVALSVTGIFNLVSYFEHSTSSNPETTITETVNDSTYSNESSDDSETQNQTTDDADEDESDAVSDSGSSDDSEEKSGDGSSTDSEADSGDSGDDGQASGNQTTASIRLMTNSIIITTNCSATLPSNFITVTDAESYTISYKVTALTRGTSDDISVTDLTGNSLTNITPTAMTISASVAGEYNITYYLTEDDSVSADLTVTVQDAALSDIITQSETSIKAFEPHELSDIFEILDQKLDNYKFSTANNSQVDISDGSDIDSPTICSNATGDITIYFTYTSDSISYCYSFTLTVE